MLKSEKEGRGSGVVSSSLLVDIQATTPVAKGEKLEVGGMFVLALEDVSMCCQSREKAV